MPEGGHCMRKKDFDRTSELVEKNVPLTAETESCYIHMLGNANEMVRKLAFQWFLAKAEEGVSSAESVVALCYRSGIGTVRDDSRLSCGFSGQCGTATAMRRPIWAAICWRVSRMCFRRM